MSGVTKRSLHWSFGLAVLIATYPIVHLAGQAPVGPAPAKPAATAPASPKPAAASATMPAPVALSSAQDRQRQMDILKITSFPSGPASSSASTYDEATANPYPKLPDPLVMKNGTKVTTAAQWKVRRAEILADLEQYDLGKTPKVTPKVTWSVVSETKGTNGDVPIMTKMLRGHADNSAYPAINVDIELTLSTPANASGPVPVMMQLITAGFGAPAFPPTEAAAAAFNPCALTSPPRQGGPGAGAAGAGRGRVGGAPGAPAGPPGAGGAPVAGAAQNAATGARAGGPGGLGGAAGAPGAGRGPAGPTWSQQALALGWGYATLNTNSIQADMGCGLTAGIIGLVNHGQPRKMDDWGWLSAVGWGASRALDYFQTDKAVDATRVGLEGHSRWGKATLVAMALDQRFAIGYISSSGEGGAKLHRRKWGETVENLTAASEYHWMAGNFMNFAGRWDRLPVDAHDLIALCAPRPVFLSAGKGPDMNPDGTVAVKPPSAPGVTPVVAPNTVLAANDAWVDAKGSFLAAVGAGPVYRLLGKKDLGTTEFPPIETGLMDGDLTFRQHSGGHTDVPNWPTFFTFATREFKTMDAAKTGSPKTVASK